MAIIYETAECSGCGDTCNKISLETFTYKENCCYCEGLPRYEFCESCDEEYKSYPNL